MTTFLTLKTGIPQNFLDELSDVFSNFPEIEKVLLRSSVALFGGSVSALPD